MSEWISVEDELPEVGQPVIVHGDPYKNKPPTFTLAVVDHSSDWHECDSSFGWIDYDLDGFTGKGFNDIEGVTHWMPLPEPPCKN